MFQGYLTFGCTEIANTSRAAGQARDAGCPIWWLEVEDCDTLPDAVNNGQPYDRDSISTSPWYDKDDPVSARFLGVYPVRIEGIENSTRTATIVQGIANGGDVSGRRSAVKTVRMVAELVAYGQDALEYGLNWLSAAMESDECSTHDGTCGESDLTFFASCPPVRRPNEDGVVYEAAVDRATRMLHGVSAISGPTIMERHERPHHGEHGAFGYLVEVVFACSNPFVFSLPKRIQEPSSAGQVIQDIPYNLAKYPSAEVPAESFIVAQNFSTNPSLETNDTAWSAAPVTGDISPFVSSGRSNDLAAQGAWSYRLQILGTDTITSGTSTVSIEHDVTLPAAVAGERFSFSVWAGLLVVAGTTPGTGLNSLTVSVRWNDSLFTSTPLGSTSLASEMNGKVFSAKSIQRPTGATACTLTISANVKWRSGPGVASDIRLYADAAAITKP